MQNKGAPWAMIIVLLFLFFPAGIIVMLVKLHKDPFHYTSNGNGTMIVGWILFVFGIFYLIIYLSDSATNSDVAPLLSGAAFCCGGGFALVRHGRKYKQRGLLVSRYITCIMNSSDGSIGDIAASLGFTYENTYRDIVDLIQCGALPDSYIDESTNCVVSAYIKKRVYDYKNKIELKEEPKKFTSRTVKCPNCGGMNSITGNDNECEYCGSPLAYECM
ncbi:hypothetical protein [Anaerotignum propionicum]|uniref:hypothetical protein n=1 Tax=Anaerotignum propionicum TaxID=28446 RepID=UPI002B21BD99|nr:hypothetical protein [Anaerotignum propionicum]